MATNKSWKIGVFRGKFFCRAAILNRLEYQNASGQLRSALNVATLYTKSVMFGAVTLEKCLFYFCTFVKKMAKMGISDQLSQNVLD